MRISEAIDEIKNSCSFHELLKPLWLDRDNKRAREYPQPVYQHDVYYACPAILFFVRNTDALFVGPLMKLAYTANFEARAGVSDKDCSTLRAQVTSDASDAPEWVMSTPTICVIKNM